MRNLLCCVFLSTALTASSYAGTEPQKITLTIPTMDCATCPITIRTSLIRTPGVISAKVSYSKREAVVVFDDAKVTVDTLKKATADAGYPSFLKSASN